VSSHLSAIGHAETEVYRCMDSPRFDYEDFIPNLESGSSHSV